MQRVVLKTKGNTTEIWNVFCFLSVGFQLLRTNSDNFMVFLQYRLQGCFLWDGAQFYLFLGGEKRNNHSLAKKENTNHIFSGSKCVFDRWWGKSDKISIYGFLKRASQFTLFLMWSKNAPSLMVWLQMSPQDF